MANTPKFVSLEIRTPDLQAAIREALELAWENGYEAAVNNEKVVDDLDCPFQWINNPFTED